MKNKIFTDRKVLAMFLGVIMVSILTLTLAYAALSVTLNIQGNARVSAADWDIYLNNPRVASGSATTNLPVIKTSSTLEFETTLNMPGDFYEFTVDVVNNGSIDAMIENVVKNPELTAEQAKYLKYEITYQNGELITTKQTLPKKSTMPIKVRIEYRKDLVASDLPTGQVVLDLSLTLEYVQSDGSGSSVKDNGELKLINVVSGTGTNTSDEVCIGEECFYVMYSDDDTVTMLAKYNLHVGNEVTALDVDTEVATTNVIENPTGIQSASAKGLVGNSEGKPDNFPWIGTVVFSSINYWYSSGLKAEYGTRYPAYVYDSNSPIYNYVENYKTYLSTLGVAPIEARLITYEELKSLGCRDDYSCGEAPSWVYATSYWSGSANYSNSVLRVGSGGYFGGLYYYYDSVVGVRPVIVISKDYFS